MAMADIVNLSNDITVNSVCRSYYKDFKFIVSYRDFNHKIAGIIAEASNDYLISCVQNMSNEAKSPSDEEEPMDCDGGEFMDFDEKCSLECNNIECNNKYFMIGMSIIDNGDIEFKVHSVSESLINIIDYLQCSKINKVEFGSSPQSCVTAYLTSVNAIYYMYNYIILQAGIGDWNGIFALFTEKLKYSKEDKVGTLIVFEPAKCVDNCLSSGSYDDNDLDAEEASYLIRDIEVYRAR